MWSFVTFNIYLFYGLVFFAIGCVVVFRNFKYSQLAISPTLWALALFGFAHAFHEWSELYVILFGRDISDNYQDLVQWLRLAKLFLSFVFLMVFSWLLYRFDNSLFSRLGRLSVGILSVLYLICITSFSFASFSVLDTFEEISVLTRFLLGFGAATLAGIGIARYGLYLRQQQHCYGQYFVITGVALIVYGVLAGLVPTQWHACVPVFRTLAATLILISLYKALKVFDIEKERSTEAKLKRAIEADKYQAIGQLAMGVAHEINNPLASSSLALDILQRKLPQAHQAELTEYISRSRVGINRAADIAKELLAYARPSTDKHTLFDWSKVINGALSLLSHKINQYQIKVICEPNSTMLGQAVKLEELVINLVHNAMDASLPNGNIEISVYKQQGSTVLQVSDQGDGMDANELMRATELFYSSKPIGKGTGLGLAICEQIANSHGGKLVLRSEQGKGCQAQVFFRKRVTHDTNFDCRR
ncbi:HAMP domain-containing histidine kinase [Shewanella maritima]|uniref:histidine kinase n=1 Tax=Shewanella maritima TaxID=2520507 RepID=A0A411PFX0_9GAMM|nr:HAMP domain-containing sensor histidine kinase [Shewanella maritima]QBF82445.1 HAMP domain-containing histidine kinase [Shewanella maritima]